MRNPTIPPGVTVENRLRVLRLIENLSLGTAAVGYRTESMHGAVNPPLWVENVTTAYVI